MAPSYLVETSAQDLPKDLFIKWWEDVCIGKLKGTKGKHLYIYKYILNMSNIFFCPEQMNSAIDILLYNSKLTNFIQGLHKSCKYKDKGDRMEFVVSLVHQHIDAIRQV
jgi:hypothetical protein